VRQTANPKVIAWAIGRCHKTPDDLKDSVSPRVQQWIDGEGNPPTPIELERLAKVTRVLMPHFFEHEVPGLSLQIPDYRTNAASTAPSPELYDTINQTLSRQVWLSGYREDSGEEPLDFIGSCKDGDDWMVCATRMRGRLELNPGWARNMNPTAAVRTLRKSIESTGTCVFAGSAFGNAADRPFDVGEFRGIVLSDRYSPIIFLNTRDTCSCQLFTLAHEFAHLLFGETGVDDVVRTLSGVRGEGGCDAVAAEFLVPEDMVHTVCDAMGTDEALEELKRLTKVPDIVLLRRAYDLGLISQGEFDDRLRTAATGLAHSLAQEKNRKGYSEGPDLHSTYKGRLGKRFPKMIWDALQSEYLLFRDAYQLTGMRAKDFEEFFRMEGKRV